MALVGSCGGGGGTSDESGGSGKVVVTDTTPSPTPSTTASPSATPTPTPTPTASPTTAPTAAPTATPSPGNGYQLVWQDEFNGSAISARCWDYVWTPFNNASELQAFVSSPKNSLVKDGMLNIVALKENATVNGRTFNYTSAELMTLGKASWTYGRFEARIRIPKGQGFWPTFWMIPQDGFYGDWPNSGEIDIAEWIGSQPKDTYQSIHGPGTDDTRLFVTPKDTGDDFHVFALEWSPTGMVFFVDGAQTNAITTWTAPAGFKFPAPFDKPFFIFLNLAIGGEWGGPPNAQTVFPATMLVDYVRVYQKTTSTAAPFQCS
jgi:beta-glucanase (GH16 family)